MCLLLKFPLAKRFALLRIPNTTHGRRAILTFSPDAQTGQRGSAAIDYERGLIIDALLRELGE